MLNKRLNNSSKNSLELAREKFKKVWKKYPSIETSLNKLSIDLKTLETLEWVATEKVHGANFCLITDGRYVCAAKRTSFLEKTDVFYKGWEKIVEYETSHVIDTFNYISKNIDNNISMILIYGELFGGFYHINKTNPDYKAIVKIQKNHKHIQKGVSYSPKHHFYPFDINIINKPEPQTDGGDEKNNIEHKEENIGNNKNNKRKRKRKDHYFLTFEECEEIFEKIGFEVYAKTLKKGTLNEVINAIDVNHFETTIPKRLNLSIMPDDGLIAEGIVVRTFKRPRVCIKVKCDQFSEIQKGRFDKSKNYKTKKKKIVIKNLSEIRNKLIDDLNKIENINGTNIVEFIESCINDNRLDTVASKIGSITMKTKHKIGGLFVSDVWNELIKHNENIKEIESSDKKSIKSFIAECVKAFMARIGNE